MLFLKRITPIPAVTAHMLCVGPFSDEGIFRFRVGIGRRKDTADTPSELDLGEIYKGLKDFDRVIDAMEPKWYECPQADYRFEVTPIDCALTDRDAIIRLIIGSIPTKKFGPLNIK